MNKVHHDTKRQHLIQVTTLIASSVNFGQITPRKFQQVLTIDRGFHVLTSFHSLCSNSGARSAGLSHSSTCTQSKSSGNANENDNRLESSFQPRMCGLDLMELRYL